VNLPSDARMGARQVPGAEVRVSGKRTPDANRSSSRAAPEAESISGDLAHTSVRGPTEATSNVDQPAADESVSAVASNTSATSPG